MVWAYLQCAYISAKIEVEMLTDLIVHAQIKDYGYSKKEDDNKYGKKEEYKKVGTCKMEGTASIVLDPKKRAAVTRDLQIKWFGLICIVNMFLPRNEVDMLADLNAHARI